VTSLGWEVGRALTNAVLIVLVGSAVLGALRRADRRFAFSSPVRFEASETEGSSALPR
jgi:energy-coupling factor transport system substrate-specific component